LRPIRTFTIKPVCAKLIAHEFGFDMQIEGCKVEVYRRRAGKLRCAKRSRMAALDRQSKDVSMLKGFSVPLTLRGKSALATLPPWHYSSDCIAIEFWADKSAIAAVLPRAWRSTRTPRQAKP
jgi:hypothetical protein